MDEIIHVRRGTSSKQLSLKGWKLGEWEERNGIKRRVIESPAGTKKYFDYICADGLHELSKYLEEKLIPKGEIKEKKEKEEPAEATLYRFIKTLEMTFCLDQFANECVVYKNKYYDLHAREIKAIISSAYFMEYACVFSNAAWEKVVNVLSSDCSLNQKYFPIRCHTKGEIVYYDTGDKVYRFYAGKMYEDENQQIIFRRYSHQLKAELEVTEKSSKELIEEVTALFNIQDFRAETIPPFFCSEHPQPMYLITGDPGAAKSTFTLFLKMLVDPDQADKLTMPDKKSLHEFGLHRQQFYLLLYDNIRSFYQEQSDELCRMITGGTSIARKLYTNGELFMMKGLPRIVGNGLRPEPSSFNDLLDRTLLFDMNRIIKSQPETIVWAKLNRIIPQLRYACLRDVSKAITLAYEQEFHKVPRMSEYALLCESLNVLWGGELGSFMDWFNNKMEIAHASGMDDPLTVVLCAYLEAHKGLIPEGIGFSTSEWRFKLEEWAKEHDIGFTSSGEQYEKKSYMRPSMALCIEERDFPKNSVWLGRRFRDLSPLMRMLGYSVSVVRSPQENKVIIKTL